VRRRCTVSPWSATTSPSTRASAPAARPDRVSPSESACPPFASTASPSAVPRAKEDHMNRQKLEDVAAFVVREAGRLGASDCDIATGEYESVDTGVRLGEVEQLEGAQGRDLRFRAFVGQNSATCNTSDFRRRSLTRMVRETVAMARASQPDPFAGLPDRELFVDG